MTIIISAKTDKRRDPSRRADLGIEFSNGDYFQYFEISKNTQRISSFAVLVKIKVAEISALSKSVFGKPRKVPVCENFGWSGKMGGTAAPSRPP